MDRQRENNNKNAWKRAIGTNVTLYPSERAVSFLARNFGDRESNRQKKALDIGFGGGCNLRLLLDYNFMTYGIDYAKECIDTARKIIGEDENLKELILGDFGDYDFEGNGISGFDAVIMWGVAFLRTKNEMLSDLKRVRSILNGNGKFFLNFRTKDDSMYASGREIDEGNTYILDCKGYENFTFTFLDQNEAEKIMAEAGFKIDCLERQDYWKNNMSQRHSWWIITASKK